MPRTTPRERSGNVDKRRWKLSEVQTMLLDNEVRLKADVERNASQDDSNNKWAGSTWDESMKMLLNGWKAGVDKLDVTPLTAIHEANRPMPVWDVAGSEVDMGAYLAGVPECMTETVRRKRPAPVVRIGVDKAISCACPAARIENMGRNILLLVEGLRLAGVPAEVWVCQAVMRSAWDGGGDNIYDLGICVQEPGRPIDVSTMAYWVGHPSALRRTIFGLEELEPDVVRKRYGFQQGGGYGMPVRDHGKDEFEEWAPSPESSDSVITTWVQDVLQRRAGR